MAAPTVVASGFTTASGTTSLTLTTPPQVGDLLIIVAGTGDANPTFTYSNATGGSITFDTGSQVYNVTGASGGITPDFSTTDGANSLGVFFWSAKVTAFTAGSGSPSLGATNWSVVTVPHRWGYYIVRPGSGSSWPSAATRVLRTGSGSANTPSTAVVSVSMSGSTAANPYFSIMEYHGVSRSLSGTKWDNSTLDNTAGNIDAGSSANVLTQHHCWDSADSGKPDGSLAEMDQTATATGNRRVGIIVYKAGGVSAAAGTTTETDVASKLPAKHVAPIGGTTETDTAGAMSRLHGRAFNLTGATETDVARKMAAQRSPAPHEHDVASAMLPRNANAPQEHDTAHALTAYRMWAIEEGLSTVVNPNAFPDTMNVWARTLTGAGVGDMRISLRQNGITKAASDWAPLTPIFAEYSLTIPHFAGPYTGLSSLIELRCLEGDGMTPLISQIELLYREHHIHFKVTFWADGRTTVEQDRRGTMVDDHRITFRET